MSPDKRSIFLENEEAIIEEVKVWKIKVPLNPPKSRVVALHESQLGTFQLHTSKSVDLFFESTQTENKETSQSLENLSDSRTTILSSSSFNSVTSDHTNFSLADPEHEIKNMTAETSPCLNDSPVKNDTVPSSQPSTTALLTFSSFATESTSPLVCETEATSDDLPHSGSSCAPSSALSSSNPPLDPSQSRGRISFFAADGSVDTHSFTAPVPPQQTLPQMLAKQTTPAQSTQPSSKSYDAKANHVRMNISMSRIHSKFASFMATRTRHSHQRDTAHTPALIDDIQTQLSKSDFEKMRVVGQFNLGFILAQLRLSHTHWDLFIVDQHASDEIYNYEQLSRRPIACQPLIRYLLGKCRGLIATRSSVVVPLPPHESIGLESHAYAFKHNGFQISSFSPLTLTGMPVCEGTTLEVRDAEELVHLLQDASVGTHHPSKVIVECSKIKTVRAMKACRKSCMIGNALERRHMHSIVRHMSGLEKPWNCPHGRPTLRWLLRRKYDANEPKAWHAISEVLHALVEKLIRIFIADSNFMTPIREHVCKVSTCPVLHNTNYIKSASISSYALWPTYCGSLLAN